MTMITKIKKTHHNLKHITRRLSALASVISIALCNAPGASAIGADDPIQHADCGSIERLNIYSPQLDETVAVDVWLPEDYKHDRSGSYPVIYMHDGQNLFDASTTWNHQAWEIDSVMCRLISEDKVRPAIVVGIHSSAATRVGDLMPQKAVIGRGMEDTLASVGAKDLTPRGDKYAAFIVGTLKPAIDTLYATLPDRDNTAVMGSSMGGLMSIYALCEYPATFGTALCLSTHWVGAEQGVGRFSGAMYDYIDAVLPEASSGHHLYFDHGTETIDAAYGPAEEMILELIRSKGYGEGTLLNGVYPGAAHEENAWKQRVAVPLTFFLHR